MKKPTKINHSVNTLIRERWSPRAFDEREVEQEKINSLLEAARWAPSAFNEQPWRFVVGLRGDDTHAAILESLVDWNKQWAGHAPVLVLNLAKKHFTHNNQPNEVAVYDLGQAVAFMVLEAVNQGLVAHQMTGFDPKKAAQRLNIPDDYHVVSVTAFGYSGDPALLPDDIRAMESGDRQRKEIAELLVAFTKK